MSVAENENKIIGYCGVFLPAPGVEADILTWQFCQNFADRASPVNLCARSKLGRKSVGLVR